ncbi:MAG: hypothetical protein B7X11_00265 [Acidobacteria bacterium 37-65-4]|nr:MAG: hypothetical protein B7X11_00265 [Acidobacteria bacterium 37-65-4]
MNGTLVVAARDFREKWTVFVAALVAGLVALVVPFFSSVGAHNTRDARDLMALIFAGAFAFGVAVVAGAGMINRDLTERRLGFLFARPLSAAAIWGGKVLACWVLAVGSGLVVLLPAAAVGGGLHLFWGTSRYADGAATFVLAAAAVLLVILLFHAIALMARSRMPWLLALDAVLAVAVVMTVAFALRPLVLAFALHAATRGAFAFAVTLLVASFAAGFAQVSLGRTDIRRGHQVLSATLWGTLGVAALLVAGYAHWVASVKPSDLTNLGVVVPAPKGAWVFVTGRARGHADYEPSFLLDTATGRSVDLGAEGRWWSGAEFAADGTRAVWLSRPASFTNLARDVVTLDLTDPKSEPVTTRINVPRNRRVTRLDLSPDGGRLALCEDKTVSVVDLLTGRLLASARLPGNLGWTKVLWVGSAALDLAAWTPTPANADQGDMRLFEFDVERRSLTETGRVAGVGRLGFAGLLFDPATGRLVVRVGPRAGASLVLCDARTGAPVATLATCAGISGCDATILAGGTIAVGEAGASGVELRLLSATGALQRTIPVGPGRALAIGGQPTPVTLVITTQDQAQDLSPDDGTAVLVDIDTGTVAPLGRGYVPLASGAWAQAVTVPAPGSAKTRAFIDPNQRFALLDPATGAFRAVLSAQWPTN